MYRYVLDIGTLEEIKLGNEWEGFKGNWGYKPRIITEQNRIWVKTLVEEYKQAKPLKFEWLKNSFESS